LGIHRSIYFTSDNFDFKIITKEMIRFGFLIKLPFRIRLGCFYRQQFEYKGNNFEIILYNKIAFPKGTELHKVLLSGKSFNSLWTEAFIIIKNPQIEDDIIEKLKQWESSEESIPPNNPMKSIFLSMEALNHFITAYSTATNQLFGGSALRVFRTYDFIDSLYLDVQIYYPAEEKITDEDILKVFNLKFEREFVTTGTSTGELYDLENDKITEVISQHMRRQENFIHYELAFEAKTKMVAGDFKVALLLAVAALEAAHSAFIQGELWKRLPEDSQATPEDFIKELGMTLCNDISPFLFLSDEERPPTDLIQKARNGIKYRNEIMHALQNRKGEYRIRNRTNKDISEAYSAVLKVYSYYVKAIEKRLL